MPDLTPLQWFALAIAVPTATTCILGWLLDGTTTEPDTNQVLSRLHHLPRSEFVRYVQGVDAEAVQRNAKNATPVVPGDSFSRKPYWYRRN